MPAAKGPGLTVAHFVATIGLWTAAALLQISPLSAGDRALLVGLERYAHPRINPTPGGAEDARSMARALEGSFGFPPESIRLLIDEQATSAAILGNFREWLIEGTDPGDRVFFLYAGHGSQLPDQNGDEGDGLDETLAPWDTDPLTGARQIRDDEIDGLIAQLAGRRAVLLFDSCHSGTLTRGAGKGGPIRKSPGARLLPRPAQLAQWSRRTRGAPPGATYHLESTANAEQRSFDDPMSIGRLPGVVAISAAGPGQLAYPIEVDGRYRGALSYLFEQVISPVGNRGLLDGVAIDDLRHGITIAELESLIEVGMERLRREGRLQGDQKPWFEVLSEEPLEEQPLYGGWEQQAMAAVANPFGGRKVALRTHPDRSRFHRGETLDLEVSTDRPGYLYLLVFSEQDQATCVFPNAADPDNHIQSGTVRIPTHAGYRLPVQPPFGRDVLMALVSDQPLPLCEQVDYTWSEVLSRMGLRQVHELWQRRVRQRGLGVEMTRPSMADSQGSTSGGDPGGPQTPPSDLPPAWQTTVLVVETVDGV